MAHPISHARIAVEVTFQSRPPSPPRNYIVKHQKQVWRMILDGWFYFGGSSYDSYDTLQFKIHPMLAGFNAVLFLQALFMSVNSFFSTLHIFPFYFHVAYFIQKQSNTVVNPIISHAHYSHRWVGFKSIPGMVGKSISIMSSLYHHFCSLNHRFPSFLLVKSSDFSFLPWSNPNLSPFLHHSNMVDSC